MNARRTPAARQLHVILAVRVKQRHVRRVREPTPGVDHLRPVREFFARRSSVSALDAFTRERERRSRRRVRRARAPRRALLQRHPSLHVPHHSSSKRARDFLTERAHEKPRPPRARPGSSAAGVSTRQVAIFLAQRPRPRERRQRRVQRASDGANDPGVPNAKSRTGRARARVAESLGDELRNEKPRVRSLIIESDSSLARTRAVASHTPRTRRDAPSRTCRPFAPRARCPAAPRGGNPSDDADAIPTARAITDDDARTPHRALVAVGDRGRRGDDRPRRRRRRHDVRDVVRGARNDGDGAARQIVFLETRP